MSNNSSKWVQSEALLDWKSQMGTLNQEAVDVISDITNKIQTLNDSWKGDSAMGFESIMGSTLETIISCHEDMQNLESFLSSVVNVMENQ